MGFLALVAFATALGPLVFDVSPVIEHELAVLEWLLVSAFAAEFVLQGMRAPDGQKWLWNYWRIIELATILGPVLALLPQVSSMARGSLVLRILRVGRAVAFGTRAGSVAVRAPHAGESEAATRALVATLLAEQDERTTTADWNHLLVWTRELSGRWLHAMNLDQGRFVALARAADVSEADISRLFASDAHAQIRDRDRSTTLILQVPVVPDTTISEVRRERVLVIVTRDGVLTATTGALDLQSAVALAVQRTHLPEHPFSARVVYAVLAHVRDQNLEIARRFDDVAHGLEGEESGSVGSAFLTRSFNLRRQLSTAALDLWHVKNVVDALAEGKAKLAGTDLKSEKALDTLLAEVDSLYETVNKVKDEVKSLIELHINVKSFEMNRLLKLLAIVSFLGLIPSVIGGLLGMNVMGNPWPVTLGQVAFTVAMAMSTAMYVFAVKGWLK